MSELKESLIKQIDSALDYSETLRNGEGNFQASAASFTNFITIALAAIARSTAKDSVYNIEANKTINTEKAKPRISWAYMAETMTGMLRLVKTAIESGYLDDTSDLIHGSIFADFLEMAQHLLDKKYKDASAVIAGSSLEAHLRHLCEKHNINTHDDKGLPKKADLLNAELAKAKAYEKIDQKNVGAWLGLRNDAAHGNYDKYNSEMVSLLIAGIREFITRSSNIG